MTTPTQTSTSFKKTALAAAITLAASSGPATADIYTFSFNTGEGLFTMLDPNGNPLVNTSKPYYYDATWGYGVRTQISGTFTFDTSDNSGSASFNAFEFFNGSAPAEATGILLSDAGSDPNSGNPLVMANMLFNWSGNNGIPVALVWDIKGLLDAINGGLTVGDTVTGSGTLPASDGVKKGNVPIGPIPVASTTWDATNTCDPTITQQPPPDGCMTVNPIGALPLIADPDDIGGDPMVDGPFIDFNANFDLVTLTLDTFVDTTPPAITLGGTNPTNLNVGDTYTETATCTDAVDGDLTGSMVIGGGPVDTGSPGTFNLTYDCSDTSANAATQQTRTVNVTLAGTPAITLLGDSDTTHEAATPYTDAGATCDDGFGTDIPLPTNNPPEFFDVSNDTVNENVPGNYSVVYSCTNSSGTSAPDATRTVNVTDTTPPVITLTPDCTGGITQIADGTDPTPTATAVDTVDGTVPVTQTSAVDPNPDFGDQVSVTFNLGFTATDAAGNPSPPTGCAVTLGNPDPVASLNATSDGFTSPISIASGASFNDPGASCEDFVDGDLGAATPDQTITAGTPDGVYNITYTCPANSQGNIASTTRQVLVGFSFVGQPEQGSTFVMIDPGENLTGGATDILFAWDGRVYNDESVVNDPGMSNIVMASVTPTPFFGFPWVAHSIYAFGPGEYTFPTSRGNTLTLNVGENQIGARMLFDWNNNNDIDVVLTWDVNGSFVGSSGPADDLGAKGRTFSLATVDGDGDGVSGTPMADGPFEGFNATFNILMSPPQFALPDASARATQAGNDPAPIIANSADPVSIITTLNKDIGGVFTHPDTFTYDWSASDQVLLGAATGGTSSATFDFNPSGMAPGAATARVNVSSGDGVTSTVEVPLSIAAGVPTDSNIMDSDADGIPDAQDGIDNTNPAFAGILQADSGNDTSFLMQSSAGTLVLGTEALRTSAQSGLYQAAVSADDIGVQDGDSGTCLGGCFSFEVRNLTVGGSADVVLPLSEPIPEGGRARKFFSGTWHNVSTDAGNAVMSATGSSGDCPSPGDSSWTPGLTTNDNCVKLTLVDGGLNDADSIANGVIRDPSGITGPAPEVPIPSGVGSASTGGCTIGEASPAKRADWWLIGGLLGWLGLVARRWRSNPIQ